MISITKVFYFSEKQFLVDMDNLKIKQADC